jgi:NAD(P)-dependent dehydrogenase (short-subunit alcohol dehydrogenase family)
MSKARTEKIGIVTGAAGGFGRVIVEALVAQGMRVGACDIDEAVVRRMEADYGKDRVLALPADISDPISCSAQIRAVVDHFNGLHVLINNAALGMGLVRKDHFTRPVQIEDIEAAIWQRIMAVNVNGAFFLAKAAIPIFRTQNWGRIINVTTSFSTMLRPGWAPYGPAKAALEAWSVSLAVELGGSGITVNVVVPGGPADTAMVPIESGLQRQKLISPDRMAPPILWLCSEEGSEATGRRYLASDWDPAASSESPTRAGWPDLAGDLVWPPG